MSEAAQFSGIHRQINDMTVRQDRIQNQDSQTCFLAAKHLNRQLDSASDFRLATDR